MAVGDRHRIDLGDGLALRQRLQHRIAVVEREAPADRADVYRVGGIFVHRTQRERSDLAERLRLRIARQIGVCVRRLQNKSRRMGVRQIDVLIGDRATGRQCCGRILNYRAGRRGQSRHDRRHVIGASGDRYCKRLEGRLVVRREIVVDLRDIGQRQRFAGGNKVKGAVDDAVGPGHRTGVLVGGVGDQDKIGFHRRDVGKLLRVQRRGDVVVLGVLVGKRTELRLHRRRIAGVEVGKPDDADSRIDRRALRNADRFDKRAVDGKDGRRPRNVRIGVDRPGRARNRRRDAGGQVHDNREGTRPIRQFDRRECLRNDRIRELMILRLGVGIVGEFQREHVGDELLHIGRQRSRIGRQNSLAEGLDHSGLIHRRDRRKGNLVEQNIPARGAVRFDQNLEFCRRRGALARDVEVDLDQHRGAADAHGGDRGVDFHVAVFGRFAGDKSDGPRHQAEQR